MEEDIRVNLWLPHACAHTKACLVEERSARLPEIGESRRTLAST